jgi:hypothetical protein
MNSSKIPIGPKVTSSAIEALCILRIDPAVDIQLEERASDPPWSGGVNN